ncbi:MAG: alpha-amylase family glycosyl hydrolase, partial [Candidatus Eremiobacteraeota bacterium]|nr:alpha-amylase family glycosyl hydrolase [Candidatus Eremiobacteraeota bacterium]
MYQVYPRSFQDSDGNGIGDLRGITRRLDYLQWLGVDALWISPFFRSPMRDFGYDVSDYTAVAPVFGTLADFDELVRQAHARGLHVILDFVANHTSDQHAWFEASRASRTSPKRDWYVWRDPAADGGPPNNWRSVFGGSGWTRDSTTGQYYFHQFLAAQPDLNWRNPAVRRAMYDAMRFWLARGADGFRLDAFPHMVEDSLFRDNPPAPRHVTGHGDYDQLSPLYTTHRPEDLDVLCGMRRVTDAYTARGGAARTRVLIGEIYTAPDTLVRYYGPTRGPARGCGAQLPSNFALLGAAWRADTAYAKIMTYDRALSPGQWPNWVLGNHDNPRLATRLGPAAARAAAVLLLTLRGTPTVYYGDEIGMRDVSIPPALVQDPAEKQQPGLGLGRDPERTPMQWDSTPQAGFTTGRPWLPVAADAPTRNVADERADSASMLTLYHDLLTLRRTEPALAHGTFRMLARQGDVLAYVRTEVRPDVRPVGQERLLVLMNFAATSAVYTLDANDLRRFAAGAARARATRLVGTHGSMRDDT